MALATGMMIVCYCAFISSRPEMNQAGEHRIVSVREPAPRSSSEIDAEFAESEPVQSVILNSSPNRSPLLQQVDLMLADAHREMNEGRRERMLVHTIAWLERRGLASILEVLGDENGESSEMMSEAKARILENLARTDPQAAAALALNHEDAIDGVLATWASRDLSEAISWVEQLPSGEVKGHAVLSVASEAMRSDPQSALRIASELPVSNERDELLKRATSEWTLSSPSDALSWVQQIDDDSLRSQLMAVVTTVLSERDSANAAQFALSTIAPGKMQNDAVVGIVQRWTQHDPASAAAWVTAFPEGELRTAAVENIVKLWPSRTEAAAWLNSLAPGASRDNGLRAYAEQIAPAHPREAAAWATTIANPQMQVAQLEKIVRSWMDSDPTSATQWVRSASLPSGVRQHLLLSHD